MLAEKIQVSYFSSIVKFVTYTITPHLTPAHATAATSPEKVPLHHRLQGVLLSSVIAPGSGYFLLPGLKRHVCSPSLGLLLRRPVSRQTRAVSLELPRDSGARLYRALLAVVDADGREPVGLPAVEARSPLLGLGGCRQDGGKNERVALGRERPLVARQAHRNGAALGSGGGDGGIDVLLLRRRHNARPGVRRRTFELLLVETGPPIVAPLRPVPPALAGPIVQVVLVPRRVVMVLHPRRRQARPDLRTLHRRPLVVLKKLNNKPEERERRERKVRNKGKW